MDIKLKYYVNTYAYLIYTAVYRENNAQICTEMVCSRIIHIIIIIYCLNVFCSHVRCTKSTLKTTNSL